MSPSSDQRRILRRCSTSVLALVVLLAVRASLLRGLVAPVRIAGDSMAERLYGDHRCIVCQQCQHTYRFAVGKQPRGDRVVCPNCGAPSRVSPASEHRGQRVLMDRGPLWAHQLRRWDLIAFRTPDQEDQLAVKRIVGLPGEQIAIRHGDVYADGRLLRKSLAEWRRMAMVVHDDRRAPLAEAELPSRWRNESTGGGWRRVQSGWSHAPVPDSADIDWLVYHHWSCWPGPSPRGAESPVMDNYGFNQHLSRHLQPVRDVGLACRMRLSWAGGQLAFRIHDGHDWYRIELLPDENLGRLCRADAVLTDFSLPAAAYCRQVLLELAVCDGQLLFGVDERLLVQYSDISTDPPTTGSACPLGIGISRMEARVMHVQVLRDLHYLDPRGLGIAWESPRRMGASEYFVVGDNVPLSVDSRHWTTPGVPRKLLLGRVLGP